MNLMIKKMCRCAANVPPIGNWRNGKCQLATREVPITNWQHEKCQLPIGNTRSANYQLAARQHLNSDSSQQTTNPV